MIDTNPTGESVVLAVGNRVVACFATFAAKFLSIDKQETAMPAHGNKILPMRDQLSAAAAELRAWSKFESPRHSKSSLRARITPLGGHGQPAASHPIEVKNVDDQGITFYHRLPLDSRRAMLVVESPKLGRLAAEVDLTWCQFNKTGQYTSGGRFVRPVSKTA